jgi:hypothetical protein
MALETVTPASRRALLTAGLGGLLALVAGALGRPAVTRAADGDAVLVGGEYTSTTPTQITNLTDPVPVIVGNTASSIGVYGTSSAEGIGVGGNSQTGSGLSGTSTSGPGVAAASTSGTGVFGQSASGIGVFGGSDSAIGVQGDSNSAQGIYGYSDDSYGVQGVTSSAVTNVAAGVFGFSPDGTGVKAESTNGSAVRALGWSSSKAVALAHSRGSSTAILGFSGAPADEPPSSRAKTGVYGHAAQDSSSRGVTGATEAGQGVRGEATTGTGVYAIAETGTALRAEGAVRFKTSGLATIATGTRSVIVTPAGLDLTTASKILALLQGDAGGSTVVQRVAVNATTNTFTIFLTANSARAVKVSWFVIS